MDDIITNKLEGKKYSYEIANNNLYNIKNELNEYLMGRKIEQRPCSFHICFIIKKPANYIFDYKILNMKYVPLMASYSNDSLTSKLILFILNN